MAVGVVESPLLRFPAGRTVGEIRVRSERKRSGQPLLGSLATMELTAMKERIGRANIARLATVRPDGTPHIVPCCLVLDGDTIYSAVDAKSKSTFELQRLENLRSNPAATVLVDHYEDDWAGLWWVRADGRGRIIERGEEYERAKSLLQAKYRQYQSIAIPGSVIAIAVERWRGWP